MQTLENRTYEELAVGERASLSHQVEERDLLLFAAVSGDVNPVTWMKHSLPPPRSRAASRMACSPAR